MKNLIAITALSLNLGGCITLQDLSTGYTLATAGVNNPVTPAMLDVVENGAIILFSGLGAYKRDCIAKIIPQSCVTAIKAVQPYTRKLPPLLISLRSFVRNNDQVNAVVAYNTIKNMIDDLKTTATANNIQVQ